jgi:enoyl-CoA hydratase/carnithine racemase
MNQPESANALSPDLIAAIDGALTQALAQPQIRAVVITGGGTVFCGGADLAVATAMLDSGRSEDLILYMEEANDLMDRIEDYPLPVIAAVNGAALAGGLELALACDLAVASSSAVISDAHARHGFVPAWGASHRLPGALGAVAARRMMLTGATGTAAEFPEMFTAVVPARDLEQEVSRVVAEIATTSPSAVTEIKRLLHADRSARAAFRRRELSALRRQMEDPDLAEGLAAFREDRLPVYRRSTGHS